MSRVRILYDFQAEGSNELTAFAGEELTVINANLFDGWIQVKNMRGEEGIVPSTYVDYTTSNNEDDDIPPPPSSGPSLSQFAPNYMNVQPTSWNTNQVSNYTMPASASFQNNNSSYGNQTSFDSFGSFDPYSSNTNDAATSNLNDLSKLTEWNSQNITNTNTVDDNWGTSSTSKTVPIEVSKSPEPPLTEPVGLPGANDSWGSQGGSMKSHTNKARQPNSDDDDSDDFDDEDSPSHQTRPNTNPNRAVSTSSITAANQSGTLAKTKAKNSYGLETFLLHGAVKNVQESDRFSTIILNEKRQSVWKRQSPPYQVSILGYVSDKKYHGVKKFTSYEIKAQIFPQKVKRRYNHFDWLHKRLVEKFGLSICIPPLPDKAVTGNFEDEFIAKRKAGLELWLNRMASHPVVGQSEVFVHFLQCDDNSSKWKTGKRKAENDEYRGAQWFCTLTVPGESVDTTASIKERVDKFAKGTSKLNDCIKNVDTALEKISSYHTNAYKKEFVHLGEKLEELGLSMNNESLDAPLNSQLSTAIFTAGTTYKQIGNLYGEQSKTDISLLLDRLQMYRGICQTLPDVVAFEKSSIRTYEEFQQKPEKLENRSLMEVAPRREIISHVTFAEINQFNKDKVEDFNQYMRTFLQQQISFYTEITECLKRAYSNFEKIPVSPSSSSNQSFKR